MTAYSDRYQAALILAAHAHRTQERKGSDVPYIVHPVQVSVILLRHGFAEDVAIAGLLHDVVEDQDVPLARIEADFGPEVAEMVAALTERKREGDVQRPWEARKRPTSCTTPAPWQRT
jgi:(p)ppGpp synthase/HD superfamily hydrolase